MFQGRELQLSKERVTGRSRVGCSLHSGGSGSLLLSYQCLWLGLKTVSFEEKWPFLSSEVAINSASFGAQVDIHPGAHGKWYSGSLWDTKDVNFVRLLRSVVGKHVLLETLCQGLC